MTIMPKPKPKFSWEQMSSLRDVLESNTPERPQPSVTITELADRLKCSTSFAASVLRKKAKDGLIRPVKFRTPGSQRSSICYVEVGHDGKAMVG